MKKFNLDWIEKRPKKFYSEVIDKDILKVIKRLYRAKSRFITATAFENAGDLYIFYHFELNKAIYTLKTRLKDAKAESITSIYPSASWAEKEIAENYAVIFR